MGRGEDGVASGRGLAGGATGGAAPVGPSADRLLLGVLPVHGMPAGEVMVQAFLGLVRGPALFSLLHHLAGRPPCVLLRP